MAIALVQSGQLPSTPLSLPQSVTLGSAVSNSFLEVSITSQGTSPGPNVVISDTSGSNVWHLSVSAASSNSSDTIEKYRCYNAAAGTYAITATGIGSVTTIYGMVVAEFSGVQSSSDPLDQQTGNPSGPFNTSATTASVTTTTAGQLVTCSYLDGFNAVAPGAGFTTILVNANADSISEYLIQPSAGAIAGTATGGGGFAGIALATYKAAAGATAKSDIVPMIGGGRRPSNSTYLKLRERRPFDDALRSHG